MRKILFVIGTLLLFVVAACSNVEGAVAPVNPCDTVSATVSEPTFDVRANLIMVAESKLGVSEATGNNDGPEVLEFQKATGNKTGDQWCASFVAWCFQKAGLSRTGNAYSPTWFTSETTIYKPSAKIDLTPRAGDVFGVWVESKNRVGHVGLIVVWDQDEMVTTIEGNYSNKVVKQKRIKRQIYVAADWASNQSTL